MTSNDKFDTKNQGTITEKVPTSWGAGDRLSTSITLCMKPALVAEETNQVRKLE